MAIKNKIILEKNVVILYFLSHLPKSSLAKGTLFFPSSKKVSTEYWYKETLNFTSGAAINEIFSRRSL